MIFTDRFVFVHMPKTGGTFVTAALLQLYGVRWTWRTRLASTVRSNLVYRRPLGTFVYHNNKHGTCNEIPADHANKPVLAAVRNPFDLYVSQFHFGWWQRKEFRRYYAAVPGFESDYRNFPELKFEQFVRLMCAAFGRPAAAGGRGVGWLSETLARYYLRHPAESLDSAGDGPTAERCRSDMHDVRFIRTHQLNDDLHAFLVGMGYPPGEVEFVRTLGRVLPGGKGRPAGEGWQAYYTPELRAEVREREWLYFALFPEFDA